MRIVIVASLFLTGCLWAPLFTHIEPVDSEIWRNSAATLHVHGRAWQSCLGNPPARGEPVQLERSSGEPLATEVTGPDGSFSVSVTEHALQGEGVYLRVSDSSRVELQPYVPLQWGGAVRVEVVVRCASSGFAQTQTPTMIHVLGRSNDEAIERVGVTAGPPPVIRN